MRSRVVIIVDVIPQIPAQVIFTDDDQMIETLSADRANYAFGVWIYDANHRKKDEPDDRAEWLMISLTASSSRPDEIFGTDRGVSSV